MLTGGIEVLALAVLVCFTAAAAAAAAQRQLGRSSVLLRGTGSTATVLLPVLHNLEAANARKVFDALPARLNACTVSLRHEGAMSALLALSAANADARQRLVVGASTVCSERQVHQVKECGAKFLSTMFYSARVLQVARDEHMAVLGGVMDHVEATKTLSSGVTSLKFFPSSTVTPPVLANVLAKLATTDADATASVDVIVAGGVTAADFAKYLAVGATGFAIGIDCLQFKNDPAGITLALDAYLDELVASQLVSA